MIKVDSKNLIVSAVGDQSLHFHWTEAGRKDPDEKCDLALIYYGDGEGYEGECRYHVRRKGPKYHLVHDLIEEHPEILQEYKYIWLPDDDIAMKPPEVERMFQLMREYKLWIAQPSIMGWYGLDVTLQHKGCLMRFTNYVEIMCPCFEVETLKKCLHTFKENKTGWGIDHVWNQVLEQPTDKLAIIDDVVAVHTRPVGGGDTYKNQTKGKMSGAIEENDSVYEKYDLGKSSYDDLKNGKLVSTESFSLLYHNTVEYGRVYKQMEAGIDVSERLWPPSSITENLCEELRERKDISAAKSHGL